MGLIGSADIAAAALTAAVTAFLEHIIIETACGQEKIRIHCVYGQENSCTHCGRSGQALIFKVESSHLANIFEVIQEILPLIVNCGLDHICNQKAKNV